MPAPRLAFPTAGIVHGRKVDDGKHDMLTTDQVQEIVIDYSDCLKSAPTGNDRDAFQPIPSANHYSYFKTQTTNGQAPTWKQNMTNVTYFPGVVNPTPVCSLQFYIPDDLEPPVLFYYRLTNFYQNHRRYVKSLDTDQLLGTAVPASTISSGSCDPLRLDPSGKPYYPCGLIANSLFNDTFTSPVMLNLQNNSGSNETYTMTDQGIAWSTDAALYGVTKYNLNEIAVPPNWYLRWGPEGYTEDHPPPNLAQDEAFQVWMRTAGLPAFSKLARRNDNQTMKSGRYQVDIQMSKARLILSALQ